MTTTCVKQTHGHLRVGIGKFCVACAHQALRAAVRGRDRPILQAVLEAWAANTEVAATVLASSGGASTAHDLTLLFVQASAHSPASAGRLPALHCARARRMHTCTVLASRLRAWTQAPHRSTSGYSSPTRHPRSQRASCPRSAGSMRSAIALSTRRSKRPPTAPRCACRSSRSSQRLPPWPSSSAAEAPSSSLWPSS